MVARHLFHPWLQLRVLPRETWILSFTVMVNRMGQMAMPFLTIFLTTQRALSPTQAGLVLSTYGVFGILGGFGAGFLSDRIPPLLLMRASLVLSALVIATVPFIKNYGGLLAIAGVWAFVTEAYRPAATTVLNVINPKEYRKLGVSLYRFAINIGASFGPALGGLLAEKNFRALFWVNASTLIFGCLILSQLPSHVGRPSKAALPPEHALSHLEAENVSAFMNPNFLFFLLGVFCVATIYMQHESVLGLYVTRDLGLAARYFGFSFAVNTILVVILEIPLNVRTLHWSHRRCMILGALIYAVGFGAYAWASSFSQIALIVGLYTFAEMIESPAVFASVADHAPARRIGEYSGMVTMTYSLAASVAPLLGTTIYQHYGAKIVWLFCFVTGCLAAFIFYKSPWLKRG